MEPEEVDSQSRKKQKKKLDCVDVGAVRIFCFKPIYNHSIFWFRNSSIGFSLQTQISRIQRSGKLDEIAAASLNRAESRLSL